MIEISIHPDIENKTIANEYAKLLKLWKEKKSIILLFRR